MPRYSVKFEEHHIHKMVVEVEAADESEAYQKVYQSDYNITDPSQTEDQLVSKRVYDQSAQLVLPINYSGPFI